MASAVAAETSSTGNRLNVSQGDGNPTPTTDLSHVKSELANVLSCTQPGCDYQGAKKNLTRHIQTVHEKRRYVCVLCGDTFSQKFYMVKHKSIKHGGITIKCELCNESYSTKSSLREHQRIKHENDPRYTCAECGKTFMIKTTYISHLSGHYDFTAFECEHCHSKFKYKSSLTKHMQSGCTNHRKKIAKPDNFECPICQKNFNVKSNLNQHIRGKHNTEDVTLVCPKCGKVFRWHSSLSRHAQSCGIIKTTFQTTTTGSDAPL